MPSSPAPDVRQVQRVAAYNVCLDADDRLLVVRLIGSHRGARIVDVARWRPAFRRAPRNGGVARAARRDRARRSHRRVARGRLRAPQRPTVPRRTRLSQRPHHLPHRNRRRRASRRTRRVDRRGRVARSERAGAHVARGARASSASTSRSDAGRDHDPDQVHAAVHVDPAARRRAAEVVRHPYRRRTCTVSVWAPRSGRSSTRGNVLSVEPARTMVSVGAHGRQGPVARERRAPADRVDPVAHAGDGHGARVPRALCKNSS